MNNRIICTETVLARLGGDKPISREKLRQLRIDYPDLLKPVMRGRYSAEKVEKLIDILTGVDSNKKTASIDYDAIVMGRLADGAHKGEVPRH